MATTDHGLSKEELDALTPAEREAIESDLSDDEKALTAGKGTDAPEASEETDAPEATAVAAIPYQAPPVDPAKVKAALDDIDAAYDAGEITLRQRDDTRDQINRAVLKAEIAAEHAPQIELTLWDREVKGFLRDHPAYQKDVLYDALDSQVKKIAADPANAQLKDREILDRAHRAVAKHLKIGKADPSDPPTTRADFPDDAPQAAATQEFAHLDALEKRAEAGDAGAQAAYERELAKLPPAAADRYLRAA
jgi:hypothetical protein